MRGSARRRLVLFCACAAAAASGACTELQLKPYRDGALVRDYRYVHGEKYITIAGLRFCYQDHGRGDVLLILPGLGTTIDFWQLNVPSLAERYRVIAVDPPGFGKSDKPDASYDLVWICDRIIGFMDAMGIPKASLMGGSMGGHLALLIALDHPDRVEKLVLMGSSGAWPPPGFLAVAGLRTLYFEPIVIDHMRRIWPELYPRLFARQTSVTERIFRYQMAVRANPKLFAAEGRAASRALRSIFFHSCVDRLPTVRQPTLIVWGEHDPIHLHDEASRLRAGLPDSRLVIVPGCSHEVMLDRPEVFNDLVLRFLRAGTAAITDQLDGINRNTAKR